MLCCGVLRYCVRVVRVVCGCDACCVLVWFGLVCVVLRCVGLCVVVCAVCVCVVCGCLVRVMLI